MENLHSLKFGVIGFGVGIFKSILLVSEAPANVRESSLSFQGIIDSIITTAICTVVGILINIVWNYLKVKVKTLWQTKFKKQKKN